MAEKISWFPARIAEMIDITMVATTRHLLLLCAPPMARPPEIKKRTEVQIPVPILNLEKSLSKKALSAPREMTPQMMWRTPSTVAALV